MRIQLAPALLLLLSAPLANATELVRVRISQFTGAEPTTLSSGTHPGLFVLDPSIASVTLTADNPVVPEIEDDGPGRWLPVMTPAPPAVTAGKIELTITPAMSVPLGLLRFRNDRRFESNPSAFVLTSSFNGFSTPLAEINLETSETRSRVLGPTTDDPFTFRWTSSNLFGEFGGGAAGFGGEDIVVLTEVCPTDPAPTCADAPRASVSLSAVSGQELEWSWSRGEAASSSFGQPDDDTLVALCLYDDDGLALQALASSGLCGTKPCWKAQGSGFSFKDKTGGENGLTAIKLKPGIGKASISVKGRGSQLDLPFPLATSNGVRVQLLRSDATPCFESLFPAPAEVDEELEFGDSIP